MNKKESYSGRLLIVDDEREALNPVCELLQKCGYMVDGYTSCDDALARISGYGSPEELIASVSDISRLYVKPDRRQEFMRIIEKNNIITGFESEVYRQGEL